MPSTAGARKMKTASYRQQGESDRNSYDLLWHKLLQDHVPMKMKCIFTGMYGPRATGTLYETQNSGQFAEHKWFS